MADSYHSQVRMQQRGICRQKVDLILEHGVPAKAAGGAQCSIVPRQQIHEEVQQLRRQIRLWESLKDKAVITDISGDIITVQHITRRHRI